MLKKGLSIVVPVYNEVECIDNTVKSLYSLIKNIKIELNLEVIFVDDGSTDGTLQKLRSILDNTNNFKLIVHTDNKGYGAALKTGILQSSFDVVAITDADETYPNDKIFEFYEELKKNNYDMIVGARVGKNVKIPLIRKPAKWLLNKLANYLVDNKIPDLNSGLRVMKKDSVINFKKILPDGFSFTTTITLSMLTNDYKVKYEKIDYFYRAGSSKIRPIYDTLNFIQLILRTILFFRPLKIFLPLSTIMLIIGIIFILYRVYFGQAFGVISMVLIVGAIQVLMIGMLADMINKKL